MKGPVRDSSTFTFDATARTITFSAPIPASQQQILAVLNVTRGAWLYLPVQAAYGGAWASPTLTVAASTTGHSNSDTLQIFVDDGLASTAITAAALPLPSGAATAAAQATGNTSLGSIDGKLPALISGRVPVDIGSASVSIGASVEVSNDAGNPLPVSGSVSISGTTAVSGPLTDAQLRATAVPVSGTFWQTTQPVSAAALPLPSGAATAAKQPALGTAGSASVDVITVQGIASGVAQPVSGTITANAGTNLNTSALALEAGGNLAGINTKLPTVSLGAQAPSAAVAMVGANKTTVAGTASIAALNTDLITGTVSGWYDASAFCTLSAAIYTGAGVTGGQIQYEGTNDLTNAPNGTVLAYYGYGLGTAGVGPQIPGANNVLYNFITITTRYIRCRVTTAFAGGTVAGTFTFSQHPVPIQTGNTIPVDFKNINTGAPISTSPNGNTSVALGVLSVAGVINTDASAQNVAAASGSLTSPTNANNAPCIGFDVNLTAFTAGSSTGLDLYLQESPDNGTTYYDIWQCEALTAAGRARIPALPVSGRRRFRWVNRTGAATLATLTVNATGTPAALPVQRQFFDRTAGVGSGTAVLNTTTAAYDIAGCKSIAVILQQGSSTTRATFQVQVSDDGTNWMAAGPATSVSSTTAGTTPLPVFSGYVGRFIRAICTSAGSSQTMTAIHFYATA
jgi:hypothetical protein